MGRVIFKQGEQSRWINKLIEKSKLNIDGLANICGVSKRTFYDWRREKFTISQSALEKLKNNSFFPQPSKTKTVSDYWYVHKGARKGAIKRMELYGFLGTPEGRKKGGLNSQQNRRQNPEKYRKLGCNVRKKFNSIKKTVKLAETVGIILGDGGVTDYQVRITLNKKTDRQYAKYVQNLCGEVFGDLPSWREYIRDNCIELTISGIDLVEKLAKLGVGKGNKIKRQIGLPGWIWKKPEYQAACIRGLVDTDGGLYFHEHWTKGVKYRNIGLCFTSLSRPLLTSVSNILSRFNVRHSVVKWERIYIYSFVEIKKYFELFRSSNPKHLQKIVDYEKKVHVLS